MHRERIEQLCALLHDDVFGRLDAEPDITGDDAGRCAAIVESALRGEGLAQVGMSDRVMRPQANRRLETRNGLVEAAEVAERCAQIVVCVGIIRRKLDRSAVGRNRIVQSSRRFQDDAQA